MRPHRLRKLTRHISCCLGAAAGALAAGYYLLPFCVSAPDISAPPDSAVYDRHGELLGYIATPDGYRCQPLSKLPTELARALVAAEDKRYHSHGGIDPLAVARALHRHLSGQHGGGASTITMQLAKLYNPPAPRNWYTKIREALQARRLEMTHSKEELLIAYLNRADFSNLCRGAETAAHFYFGKPATELSTDEAALLAALVQAPGRLNPLRHPQAARARRDLILLRLGASTATPLGAAAHPISAPPIADGKPGQLTIDASLQREVSAIARREIERLRHRNVSQAAIVIADNRSGELLTILPAALPDSPRGGALNGTTTPRSAGSTLKPFVYLMALSHGAWPGTIMADVPMIYRSADGIQAPGNYNDRYLGPITIRQALACSQNIPAMEALNRYGGADCQLALLRNLGFRLPGNKEEYGLGLAIGNAHVTLLELVQAYSTLARNGNHLPLQSRLPLATSTPKQLLPAADCYRIAHILSDPAARAASFGPAQPLSFPWRTAAKTGTSSNFRDNWCLGFTAEFTVGVWVGNFDNSPMKSISGLSGAGPIFHQVFRLLHPKCPPSFPPCPDGLHEICIDTRTGTPATHSTPQECRRSELATDHDLSNMPPPALDARGRALLDSRYSEWYSTSGLNHLYALAPDKPSDRPPAILIPSPGTTLVLSPLLPDNGRRVELSSTLPASSTTWYSSTLRTFHRNGKWYVLLRPGTHTLHAEAPPNLKAQSTFRVIQD